MQLCQAASGNVLLSVMKLQLRLAFTTQPCPAFYKYHLPGLTAVGIRAEAGSLTPRAAVAKQTGQVNRVHSGSGAQCVGGCAQWRCIVLVSSVMTAASTCSGSHELVGPADRARFARSGRPDDRREALRHAGWRKGTVRQELLSFRFVVHGSYFLSRDCFASSCRRSGR